MYYTVYTDSYGFIKQYKDVSATNTARFIKGLISQGFNVLQVVRGYELDIEDLLKFARD